MTLNKHPMRAVRAHCTDYYRETCPDLHGLTRYGERAALMPGTAYVHSHGAVADAVFVAYHRHLRDALGIGAESVRFVTGTTLPRAIMTSDAEQFGRTLADDPALFFEPFILTPETLSFLREAGIPAERIFAPLSTEIVDTLNDKHAFNEIGMNLRMGNYFPQQYTVAANTPLHNAFRTVQEWVNRHSCVRLKLTDRGGGQGQLVVKKSTPSQVVHDWITSELASGHPLIIQKEVRGFDASLQWAIFPDGTLQRLFVSAQYITNHKSHTGNCVAIRGEDALSSHMPPWIGTQVVANMWEASMPLAQWAYEQGFRGSFGIDIMVQPDGRFYFLEVNPRTTAGTYAASIRDQIAYDGRIANPVVVLHDCYPDPHKNWTWQNLHTTLGSLAMNGETGQGILIAMPGCLTLPEPKCFLVCVADNRADAESTMREALNVVGNTHHSSLHTVNKEE